MDLHHIYRYIEIFLFLCWTVKNALLENKKVSFFLIRFQKQKKKKKEEARHELSGAFSALC